METNSREKCIICGMDCEYLEYEEEQVVEQDCDGCGHFRLVGSAIDAVIEIKKRKLLIYIIKLKGYIKDQNRLFSTPAFRTNDDINIVIKRNTPNIKERAEKILMEAVFKNQRIDIIINIYDAKYKTSSYSTDDKEMETLINYLYNRNYIDNINIMEYKITPEGYIYLENLASTPNEMERNVFIAMSFHPSMNDAHNDGLRAGIRKAGYEPFRVDQKEHIGKIDDEIIASINSSRFVVADFTGHRGGVYFEAGYAMGKGLPVFWSCREDDMGELHFDIRQYNCIAWKNPEELAERLNNRIQAVIGKGPLDPL